MADKKDSKPEDRSDQNSLRLWHQSGVNIKGEPFVQLLLGAKVIGQMDPYEARDHARAIIEAAEAAETDAFIIQWVTTHVGAGMEAAAGLIRDFRKYREERTGKKEGPQHKDDFIMPEKLNPEDREPPK